VPRRGIANRVPGAGLPGASSLCSLHSISIISRWRWSRGPSPARCFLSLRAEYRKERPASLPKTFVVPWPSPRSSRFRLPSRTCRCRSRWRATARAAAKQARRAHIPDVTEPVTTAELAGLVATTSLTIVLESDVPDRLTDLPLPGTGDILLVIGPEGGITDDELATLRQAGARAARLGTTVLRTSTAAAVALGALGALTSRWH